MNYVVVGAWQPVLWLFKPNDWCESAAFWSECGKAKGEMNLEKHGAERRSKCCM